MHKIPKEYIVYWTSKKVGKPNPASTETYKANFKTFNDYEDAMELVEKLHGLRRVGGQYMGRIVYHVGAFNGGSFGCAAFDNVRGPDSEVSRHPDVEKDTQDRVMEIIAEVLDRESTGVNLRDNFFSDLNCDSLDIVELMINLEEQFDITIDNDLTGCINTVEDLFNIALN